MSVFRCDKGDNKLLYLEEIKENWMDEISSEIEDVYLEISLDIFKLMSDEGFYSKTKTFLERLIERTELIVASEFENRIKDVVPRFSLNESKLVLFFDKFIENTLSDLFDDLDILDVYSDIFSDLSNKMNRFFQEKGAIDSQGNLTQEFQSKYKEK